ncbi:hypothetical protein DRE_00450 [Drechslerella stenobrocha 248]|uniref:Extracellular serine carboxypeptidase n=1 Tax=Drechslerella stenobrocha 248 TaxID=1043628 RepID=W7I4Z5_9PEZI|nr:hypothetical protein DRE_00450 [Drechslerella stenobrocha 248]
MREYLFSIIAALAVLAGVRADFYTDGLPQPPGLKKRHEAFRAKLERRAAPNLNATIPYFERWFPQKVDHLGPPNNNTFNQRYWISTTFYKPGGPVIVLDGGETSGAGRIKYMHTGIGRYLTEYLGGIGVVLEHRYYGKSYVTQNLSVESLKYLDTAQSLADNAYFAENLWRELPANLSHIRPSETPFISYGGSYAGAKSAFLQVVHPESYYGSLASSAVVWAGENFWEYNEPLREWGDPVCIAILEETARRVDSYSAEGGSVWQQFKQMFGVRNLGDRDAANYIFGVLWMWQSGNWDKQEPGALSWDRFCNNVTTGVGGDDCVYNCEEKLLAKRQQWDLERGIRNFAAWTSASVRRDCGDSDVTTCLGSLGESHYKGDSLAETWKLWTWQVCTEWGYFIPGAPQGFPSLMPRIIDMKYVRRYCPYAFNMPVDFEVNVTKVLQYGGYNLTAPRLMYIDGTHDPWLYATANSPHSPQKDRDDELNVLIQDAWHHNDENGLGDISKEPVRIQDVHHQQIRVVRKWVEQYHKEKGVTWTAPPTP